jgi:hypothetical protein
MIPSAEAVDANPLNSANKARYFFTPIINIPLEELVFDGKWKANL